MMTSVRHALCACVLVATACAGGSSTTTDPGGGTQPPACVYTYSAWADCQADGTQARAATGFSPSGCVGTPVLSQSCTYTAPITPPPTCTYTYWDWSSCQPDSTQTRTVASATPQGCTGTPVLSRTCTYVAPPLTPGKATTLKVVSGDTQNATVGQALALPVVVQVTDSADTPVPGQIVNFKVTQGGGSVFAGAAITDATGTARERWTLGTAAGAQKLEARAVDSTTGDAITFATFQATAIAGPPASVTVKTGSGQAAFQLTTLPTVLDVLVADQYGNALSGVAVQFVAAAGCGSASPASTTTSAAGVASAAWTLGPGIGAQLLEARVTGLPPATFSANASSGPAQQTIALLSGDAQSGYVGTPLQANVVLKVTTLNGTPISGQALTAAIVSGGGSLAPAAPVSGADGTVRLAWTVGTKPGAQQARFTTTDPISGKTVGPILVNATSIAGPPASIIGTQTSRTPTTLTVEVKDQFGNDVDGVTVTFMSGPGSAAVTPASAPTAQGGKVTADWPAGSLVGTQTVDAQVAGLTSFRFTRSVSFVQTLDGVYTGTLTETSSTGYFWNPAQCGNSAMTLSVANGMVSGAAIGNDGAVTFSSSGISSFMHNSFKGTFVTDGHGGASASGTMTYQEVGAGYCTGVWTVARY